MSETGSSAARGQFGEASAQRRDVLGHDPARLRGLGLIENKDITVERVMDGSFVKAAIAKSGLYQAAAR